MARAFLLALAVTGAFAQTYTLSGCHRHDNVEYCYLPDGTETPWTTYAPSGTAAPTAATAAVVAATATPAPSSALVATNCHAHEISQFCIVNGEEWEVEDTVDLATAPKQYSSCHLHGPDELHCAEGSMEVHMKPAGGEHSHAATSSDSGVVLPPGASCHYHAGVEHCVDANGVTIDTGCAAPRHEYNVPLRIGLLFVILVASAIGVYAPIFTSKFTNINHEHIVFIIFRQFGAGVIISTALVHLYTHGEIFFANECLTGVNYEAITGAIVLAGIFVTFCLEHLCRRLSLRHKHNDIVASSDEESKTTDAAVAVKSDATVNATVVEAGIIFHSIRVTLVVAADSAFITLFIVILFHQFFEGIALGSIIASMPASKPFLVKMLMGLAFALVTPVGMAIGIGVLSTFNGNDPTTIIVIGTFNAFSAGILLWVGLVNLWFEDWRHGPLARAGFVKSLIGILSLVVGIVLMSVIGKWA